MTEIDRILGALEASNEMHNKEIAELRGILRNNVERCADHRSTTAYLSGRLEILLKLMYGVIAVVILTVVRELVETGIFGG